MAGDQEEPAARYPRAVALKDGQKHGYVGKVELYDPPEAGHTNAAPDGQDATTYSQIGTVGSEPTKGKAGKTGEPADPGETKD